MTNSYAQNIQEIPQQIQKLKDAYGIRIGIGFRDHDATMKPVFNPYYEVPVGTVSVTAELQMSFLDFQTLNVFQTRCLVLDSYGWAGKCKWFYKNNASDGFFSSAGFGMTVQQTTASVEFPLSSGYLSMLSNETEFEGALNFTPLDYLGQRLGWFVSVSIGLRFLNF